MRLEYWMSSILYEVSIFLCQIPLPTSLSYFSLITLKFPTEYFHLLIINRGESARTGQSAQIGYPYHFQVNDYDLLVQNIRVMLIRVAYLLFVSMIVSDTYLFLGRYPVSGRFYLLDIYWGKKILCFVCH